MLIAAMEIPAPLKRDEDGHLLDEDGRLVEENLGAGNRPTSQFVDIRLTTSASRCVPCMIPALRVVADGDGRRAVACSRRRCRLG